MMFRVALASAVFLAAALQGAASAQSFSSTLGRYGAANEVGQILAQLSVREIGPILAAIIAALAWSVRPAPRASRLLAILLEMPLLALLSTLGIVMGGYLVAVPLLAINSNADYWMSASRDLEPGWIVAALWKSVTFAAILVAILSAPISSRGLRWTPTSLLAIPFILIANLFINRLAYLIID